MLDLRELIHPIAELYRYIFTLRISIYGVSVTIGSLVLWC